MTSEARAEGPINSSAPKSGPLTFSLEAQGGELARGDLGACSSCRRPIRGKRWARQAEAAAEGHPPLELEGVELRLDFLLSCTSAHGGRWSDEWSVRVQAPRAELRASFAYWRGAFQSDEHATAIVARWRGRVRALLAGRIVDERFAQFARSSTSDVMHVVMEGASHALCGGSFPGQVSIPMVGLTERACERCAARVWAAVRGDAAMRRSLAEIAASDAGAEVLGRCSRCAEEGR